MSGGGAYTYYCPAPATAPIYYWAPNASTTTLLKAQPGFESPIGLLQSGFDYPLDCRVGCCSVRRPVQPFIYFCSTATLYTRKEARTICCSMHGPTKWSGTKWKVQCSEHIQHNTASLATIQYTIIQSNVFIICICLILSCICITLHCNAFYFFNGQMLRKCRVLTLPGCILYLRVFVICTFIAFKLYLNFALYLNCLFHCICRAGSYHTDRGRRL